MTRPRKTGFPLELHGAVGSALHGMRETLLTASVFVGNTYGTAPMYRVDKVVRALDRLRCRLDSYVFQEYPALPRAAHIYYPVSAGVAPTLRATSLEGVCQSLAASAKALRQIADLLFTHYPVALGDRVCRIADDADYQSKELPYAVGPPKHQRKVA